MAEVPSPINIVRAQVSVGVAAGAMDVAIVSGTASQQILVLALCLFADAAANIYIQSEDNTALFGDTDDRVLLTASTPLLLPYNPIGWMLAKAGDDLEILSTSGTFELAGCIVYTKV